VETIEVDPRVPGNRDEFPSPQPSSALQELDSPSCPFSPKFTVLQGKPIVTTHSLLLLRWSCLINKRVVGAGAGGDIHISILFQFLQ